MRNPSPGLRNVGTSPAEAVGIMRCQVSAGRIGVTPHPPTSVGPASRRHTSFAHAAGMNRSGGTTRRLTFRRGWRRSRRSLIGGGRPGGVHNRDTCTRPCRYETKAGLLRETASTNAGSCGWLNQSRLDVSMTSGWMGTVPWARSPARPNCPTKCCTSPPPPHASTIS